MLAFDFSYQLTIESVERIATDMISVSGNCYDGSHTFDVDGNYKVGDRIFVMGYLIMNNHQVVKHGKIN